MFPPEDPLSRPLPSCFPFLPNVSPRFPCDHLPCLPSFRKQRAQCTKSPSSFPYWPKHCVDCKAHLQAVHVRDSLELCNLFLIKSEPGRKLSTKSSQLNYSRTGIPTFPRAAACSALSPITIAWVLSAVSVRLTPVCSRAVWFPHVSAQ